MIFLLNKVDLIPREAIDAWLKCLRKIAPTIAFKAAKWKNTLETRRELHSNTLETSGKLYSNTLEPSVKFSPGPARRAVRK